MIALNFKSSHRVQRAFVDPSGCHVLVTATGVGGSLTSYVHHSQGEAKELSAMKVLLLLGCLLLTMSRTPTKECGS